MLIKSKLVLFCSTFTLAVTAAMFPFDDIKADGASACPAFTSAMVDAAAMAFGLFPGAVVTAGDDPTIPGPDECMPEGDPQEFCLEKLLRTGSSMTGSM